jgi:anti-anti-sigma factor
MIFLHRLRPRSDGVRLVLGGEIDLTVREDLRYALRAAVEVSSDVTEVDLRDVTFLDCAGIAELVRAYRDAYRHGHRLIVSHPVGVVRWVLQATDLLRVLAPDEAVACSTCVDAGRLARIRVS